MSEPVTVLIPLINPNEKEARLNNIYVHEGQMVKQGDLVASLESTKATLDIFAESSGFVKGLACSTGDLVEAGDLLCYLVDDLSIALPQKINQKIEPKSTSDVVEGLRITQPARVLAEKHGIDLATLPKDRLITEDFIRNLSSAADSDSGTPLTDRHLVVFGGGGHGKSIIELVKSKGKWEILGIIDDGISVGEKVLGFTVLGGSSSLVGLHRRGLKFAINAVGGIGNLESRIKIFEVIAQAGLTCPEVIHPRSVCEPSARIEQGAQIFALAYIGSESRIGYGCIINTGAIISHDCVVGDFSNISPGAILAGGVRIEERVMVGMGATINLNVKIGANARIGNGATVKSDVPAGTIVKAGSIWPA